MSKLKKNNIIESDSVIGPVDIELIQLPNVTFKPKTYQYMVFTVFLSKMKPSHCHIIFLNIETEECPRVHPNNYILFVTKFVQTVEEQKQNSYKTKEHDSFFLQLCKKINAVLNYSIPNLISSSVSLYVFFREGD